MIIKIFENDDGFKLYETEKKDSKMYKWGYSLIELANADFSKLRKILHKEDIPFDITYKDFFKKYLNLNINSIHYYLIKFYIINFIKNRIELLNNSLDIEDNTIIEYSTLKIYEPHKFLWDFQRLIWPLLYCHDKVRNILDLFLCNKEEIKKNGKKSVLKFNKDNISSLYFDYDTYKTQFDSSKEYLNFKYVYKNNKLYTTHIFHSIPELCNYELFKFINSSTKIIKCKECGKYIVVSSAKKQYCSKKCNELYLERNPFYREYRKTYQDIHKLHYETNCVDPWIDFIMPDLRDLLNEYEKYYDTPNQESKLNEFKKKLSKMKKQQF